MRIALIYREYSDIIEGIENSLRSTAPDTVFRKFEWNEKENIMKKLEEFSPQLLITENLAGFSMTTLMDSIAYNRINSLQFHLLTNDSWNTPRNLSILKKPLSLSMSFLCSKDEYKELLIRYNPDVPFAETITDNDYAGSILSISKL